MAINIHVGQVIYDKVNDAYVRIVGIFANDVQVDWIQEKETVSYHLEFKDIRRLEGDEQQV